MTWNFRETFIPFPSRSRPPQEETVARGSLALAKTAEDETKKSEIRKTNLECALESTASLFGVSLPPSRIRSRGERVAQDSLLKSCGFSRFSTKRQMPQVRNAGLALQGHGGVR